MPLCTIHLLSLTPPTTLQTFLRTLHSTSLKPFVISRVIRWIILPTTLSTSSLLAQNIHWDILLILPSSATFPPSISSQIAHKWSITAGVPSRLLQNFSEKNKRLLFPSGNEIPELEGGKEERIADSSQGLELSIELKEWIEGYAKGENGMGAVSMLNLLAFKEGMKESYLKYGAEFAKSIGSKRGGNAKIVGSVVRDGEGGDGGDDGWDEVALAHYPSIKHFEDMLASEDYQAVNQKYRVPALRDTCILCTCELGLDLETDEAKGKAKL